MIWEHLTPEATKHDLWQLTIELLFISLLTLFFILIYEIFYTMENVIKILRHFPRPITAVELQAKLKGEKNLNHKLQSLLKYDIIKKIKFESEGYILNIKR